MKHYINKKFYYGSLWVSNEKKEELLKDGYKVCESCNDLFVKETNVPAYSSQLERNQIKYIGDEPRPVNYSIHNHQYETSYYEVKREDFERMEIKPEIEQVYRPLRLHNFDGFVEETQKERKGDGWVETYQRDFHTTITYKFFIID